MSDDAAPTIEPMRGTPACPKCNRDLTLRIETRTNGRVVTVLYCARHGTYPSGWRTKFLDNARAQVWAREQARLQQENRQRSRR